jgi:hypothetical protein
MTVVYEIVDETEWRKTNPLRYEHNGLSAVRVSIDDACELLDEAEAEVERLRGAILQAVNAFDKIPWGYDGDCGSGDIFSFLEDTLNPNDKPQ